jgi:hypothetical protein
LNDYIIFTKQFTIDEYKENLKKNIKNKIVIYEQNLEIAKTMNLEDPIAKNFPEINLVVNQPTDLFYKGSKVLSLQKLHLEVLLKNTDNIIFDYNPILHQASNPTLVTKSMYMSMFIAFVPG